MFRYIFTISDKDMSLHVEMCGSIAVTKFILSGGVLETARQVLYSLCNLNIYLVVAPRTEWNEILRYFPV